MSEYVKEDTWVAVDKDGREGIYHEEPFKDDKDGVWGIYGHKARYIFIPKGSIKKLIGRELTWNDNPVELKE